MEKIMVLIIMGSESDLPKMEESRDMLEHLGIPSEIVVASAHRTPEKVDSAIKSAEENGAEVIIAGAGMSAHLPGVVASKTELPVIGVPLDSGIPGGIDALFSIVQMPTGVPVATVAVGGTKNAAILAAQILGVKHTEIKDRLRKYRKKLAQGG